MLPRFPLYVPTKGRWTKRLTSNALTEQGVPHYLVVEPQEVEQYERASRGSLATVLPLDMAYKSRYELCDDLGLTKSTGPGPARNFIWDHSIANGHAWHWVMDDNIYRFDRLHTNKKIACRTPAFWRAQEDFVLRYANVSMAGPNYFMFVDCRSKRSPFVTNTRIYSCNLIRNDVPFRWRGRYNEDTILSLDMLKAGWCTVQFNAFLQWKVATQTLGGGNTAEFYAKEGTAPKSEMLKAVHPDVTRLVWKFGRHHHHCDYKRFKQPLLRKPDAVMESPTAKAMRLVAREKRA
jgi:hypothetical protein